MPAPDLALKLKRKPAARAAIIQAPPGYEAGAFTKLPRATTTLLGQFDWIQIFVSSRTELEKLAPKAANALAPNSILWISFPKSSSKVQTDLTRDKGWDVIRTLDLKWITLVSVNETWSAFSLRPYKAGEARQGVR